MADGPQASERRRGGLTVSLGGATGPLISLVLLGIAFSFASPYFLSLRNALNVLDQIPVLGIVAIGMTAVIVIGGIDLSVGSVLAFSMMVMGWLNQDFDVPLPLCILAAIVVGGLCGGNQQEVVIAKWVSRNPKVFILDEPTRGIDVGARAAIYNVIAELASTGMAVVVVSSDLEEVLGLSHRVLVLSRGRQRGLLDRKDTNHVAVMELATT